MWEASVPISIALIGVIVAIIKFVPSRNGNGKSASVECPHHNQLDNRLREQEIVTATVVERLDGITEGLTRLERGMGEVFSELRERGG